MLGGRKPKATPKAEHIRAGSLVVRLRDSHLGGDCPQPQDRLRWRGKFTWMRGPQLMFL